MGRNANLLLHEFLLSMLACSPDIKFEFVIVHGPIMKQPQWTKQYWGNYHADWIAKNNVCSFSLQHAEWPSKHLENLVKLHPSWPCIYRDGHLALELRRRILSSQTHFTYMNQRDAFRSKRGEGIMVGTVQSSNHQLNGRSDLDWTRHVWGP